MIKLMAPLLFGRFTQFSFGKPNRSPRSGTTASPSNVEDPNKLLFSKRKKLVQLLRKNFKSLNTNSTRRYEPVHYLDS